MKRTGSHLSAAVAVVFFVLTGTAGALTAQDFTNVVDFNMTLRGLSTTVSQTHTAPRERRLVLLTGVAASVDIVSRDKSNFAADMMLVDGQWNGPDNLALYRCVVTLKGAGYASRIPARPGAPAGPDAILDNSQVLVVGSVEGVRTEPDGTVVPVVNAILVRPFN